MSDTSRNRETARRNKLDEKTVGAFAKKAKAYAQSLVEGRPVHLEYDWQRTDKYGRTLAYVYREEDGLFINAEIIRQGYGLPIVYFPFRYKEEFRGLGDEARLKGRGLWQKG